MEIEGRGGEAAMRDWELRGEKELQRKLSFSGAAFGDDFSDTIARDAAVEKAVEGGTADCEFGGLGGQRVAEETFWFHFDGGGAEAL